MTKLDVKGACRHGQMFCKVCNPPKPEPVVARPAPKPESVEVAVVDTAPLSDVELSRLAELEEAVEKDAAAFVRVGSALIEIRDSGLYRDTHKTFEDYCKERWNVSARRARQLIAATEVVGILEASGTSGTAVTLSEHQTREVASLRDDPEALVRAVQNATVDGVTTAAKLKESAAAEAPPKKKPVKRKRTPKPKPDTVPVLRSDLEALLGGTADAEAMTRCRKLLG